jgi:hypothetical protein
VVRGNSLSSQASTEIRSAMDGKALPAMARRGLCARLAVLPGIGPVFVAPLGSSVAIRAVGTLLWMTRETIAIY